MRTLQILLLASLAIALASSRAAVEEEKRLIKTSAEKPGTWMTESEIFDLIKNGHSFVDITDSKYPAVDPNTVVAESIPTELEPRFQDVVKRVIKNINLQRVEDFIQHFSSYHNRYHASQTGRQSQLWLLSQVQEVAGNRATVIEVDHGFLQKSIVARIEGVDPALKEELVIFGAHLDSVNKNGPSLNAPGADDNASGSVVGLETLRAIVEEGQTFRRTVEIHWYAAEEIGLRGSQAIAEDYKSRNLAVHGMLNMDVVSYHVNGIDDVGVFTDNGNADLAQVLRNLAETYLEFGWRNRTCGYGCSDHFSWTQAGFRAVMASEIVPHPQMHTVNDNISNVHFGQLEQFIKLAYAFVFHMAEPVGTQN